MMTHFYKVIALAVDMLESRIIDERHFPDYVRASAYASAMVAQNYAAVIVQI